ncbi:ATP-binding protein, partial [Streptomyces decoyicus]
MTAQLDAVGREVAVHVCPLPHIPEAVSVVRRRVRTVLADWNLAPDLAEDALLVISELITNAVVHALPPAALRLARVGAGRNALRVEVTDAGPAASAGRPAGEP